MLLSEETISSWLDPAGVFGSLLRFFSRLLVWLGIALMVLCGLVIIARAQVAKELPSKRTTNAARGLFLAVRSFKQYYGHLPYEASEAKPAGNWIESDGSLMRILSGEDTIENPQQLHFYEFHFAMEDRPGITRKADQSGTFVDAWGTPFRLRLDYPGRGWIRNPARTVAFLEKQKVSASQEDRLKTMCIVVSAGPDKSFRTWEDNIAVSSAGPRCRHGQHGDLWKRFLSLLSDW